MDPTYYDVNYTFSNSIPMDNFSGIRSEHDNFYNYKVPAHNAMEPFDHVFYQSEPIEYYPVEPRFNETPNSPSTANQLKETNKWLECCFQAKQNVSISRSTIFELYIKFCNKNNFTPVCKATFGKIIRKRFPQIRSKRLGARGQSKYHVSYCND